MNLEWKKPYEVYDTATKHHVIGIDQQVVDDLADGNGVTREIPHRQRQCLRVDEQLHVTTKQNIYKRSFKVQN